jgi:hypothetical protein
MIPEGVAPPRQRDPRFRTRNRLRQSHPNL